MWTNASFCEVDCRRVERVWASTRSRANGWMLDRKAEKKKGRWSEVKGQEGKDKEANERNKKRKKLFRCSFCMRVFFFLPFAISITLLSYEKSGKRDEFTQQHRSIHLVPR